MPDLVPTILGLVFVSGATLLIAWIGSGVIMWFHEIRELAQQRNRFLGKQLEHLQNIEDKLFGEVDEVDT